jgi:MGT family glycosyltransferase
MSASGATWTECHVDQLARTRPDLVVCDETIAVRGHLSLARRVAHPVVTFCSSLPERDVAEFPEIVLCPAELDPPFDRGVQPRRYYCEPSIWRTRHAKPWTTRRTRGRLVYCSLGTQSMNYPEAVPVLRAVIAAFEGLEDVRLIVAANALYEQLAADPRPANVEIVRSVPQLALLARADLIVSHAGLGTVKEAIMAGVPILAIPFLFDQPMNARRVAFHGLGRVCAPADCSPRTIREIVIDLLGDAAVRQRVADMRAIFRAREAARPAGRLLLRALSGIPL